MSGELTPIATPVDTVIVGKAKIPKASKGAKQSDFISFQGCTNIKSGTNKEGQNVLLYSLPEHPGLRMAESYNKKGAPLKMSGIYNGTANTTITGGTHKKTSEQKFTPLINTDEK